MINPGTEGGEKGNGIDWRDAESAERHEILRGIERDGVSDETGIGFVEKLILLVIAAQEQAEILTTRIEGPVVSENALQGVIDGLRVSTVAQQRMGLFQGQLYDKIRKRAKARKPKRASRDGKTGAAWKSIPVREKEGLAASEREGTRELKNEGAEGSRNEQIEQAEPAERPVEETAMEEVAGKKQAVRPASRNETEGDQQNVNRRGQRTGSSMG